MTPKEFIEEAKDYADIADASYAMLHYIDENEEIDFFLDKLKSENPNPKIKPPARWIYADGIKLGYEIKQENITEQAKANNRKIGQPTAYALAIEARFSYGVSIKKPSEDKEIPIENTIQNFIDRNKYKPDLENQQLLVATTKEKQEQIKQEQIKEKDKQDKDSPNNLTHHLSPRTKFFTSRFKLLHHQPNTTSGFSATLFEDTQDNNQKILSIRGTEFPSGIFNDIAEADVSLALDSLPNHQYIDMLKFYCECVDKYPSLHKDNNLIIVGHSLGGALAQMLTLSLATPNSKGNIKEVYTFNSPGAKNLKPLNLDNVYEIDSTILSDANKDNKERALFKKIRDYEYENSNLLKDAILINYDSGLLNTIHKYFSNNENLKEHSIFLRTFTSTRLMPLWYGGVLSNATYSYEIIKINEIFMKCITNLKDNYQLQKPLACKDNIHHIEADNDSNPNNNKLIGNLIHNDKNVA